MASTLRGTSLGFFIPPIPTIAPIILSAVIAYNVNKKRSQTKISSSLWSMVGKTKHNILTGSLSSDFR